MQKLRDYHADIAIILGSGLNSLVVDPAKDQIVPHAEFSEISEPSACRTKSTANKAFIIPVVGRAVRGLWRWPCWVW